MSVDEVGSELSEGRMVEKMLARMKEQGPGISLEEVVRQGGRWQRVKIVNEMGWWILYGG